MEINKTEVADTLQLLNKWLRIHSTLFPQRNKPTLVRFTTTISYYHECGWVAMPL